MSGWLQERLGSGRRRHRVLSEDEIREYASYLREDDSLPALALRLALFAGGQRMRQLQRARVSDWDASTARLKLRDVPFGRRPHEINGRSSTLASSKTVCQLSCLRRGPTAAAGHHS